MRLVAFLVCCFVVSFLLFVVGCCFLGCYFVLAVFCFLLVLDCWLLLCIVVYMLSVVVISSRVGVLGFEFVRARVWGFGEGEFISQHEGAEGTEGVSEGMDSPPHSRNHIGSQAKPKPPFPVYTPKNHASTSAIPPAISSSHFFIHHGIE